MIKKLLNIIWRIITAPFRFIKKIISKPKKKKNKYIRDKDYNDFKKYIELAKKTNSDYMINFNEINGINITLTNNAKITRTPKATRTKKDNEIKEI